MSAQAFRVTVGIDAPDGIEAAAESNALEPVYRDLTVLLGAGFVRDFWIGEWVDGGELEQPRAGVAFACYSVEPCGAPLTALEAGRRIGELFDGWRRLPGVVSVDWA